MYSKLKKIFFSLFSSFILRFDKLNIIKTIIFLLNEAHLYKLFILPLMFIKTSFELKQDIIAKLKILNERKTVLSLFKLESR